MRRTTEFVMSRDDSARVLQLLGAAAVPPQRRAGIAWLVAAAALALSAAAAGLWLWLH